MRLRLKASCRAKPGQPVRNRGWECDFSEQEAAILLATHQWELIQPPADPPGHPVAGLAESTVSAESRPAETGEWTDDTAAAAAGKAKGQGSRAKGQKPKAEKPGQGEPGL